MHRLIRSISFLCVATGVAACPTTDPGPEDAGNEEGGESSEGEGEESGDSGETSDGDSDSPMSTTGGTSSGTTTNPTSASGTATTSTTTTTATTEVDTEDDSDDTSPANCTFNVTHETSPMISTVGIVTWSTDLGALDSAHIDFGRDTNYGMRAPVDLAEPELRTLLLGMVENTEYHFRITAASGGSTCTSEDFTLETGPAPNMLSRPNVQVQLPGEVTPGFLVTGNYTSGDAVVYTSAGEVVWWYRTGLMGGLSSVRMSYDGKWMIARNGNPNGAPQGGQIMRVSMDGLVEEPITVSGGHHDFTVTPDNGVVFIAGSGNCDEIIKMSEDGTFTTIFSVATAFPNLGMMAGDLCHTNSIHYNETDDSFTMSVKNQNAYLKISADGELQWVLGGNDSDFTGEGAQWSVQHGHHMISPERLLFFNNDGIGGGGGGRSSLAIEVELDLSTMTATRAWIYEGGSHTPTLGDVRRLSNGNTLVTYSSAGLIHEANAEGTLVQSLSWSSGAALGYVTHLSDLYGPPWD